MNNRDDKFADRIETIMDNGYLYATIIFVFSLVFSAGGIIFDNFMLYGFAIIFNIIGWVINITVYIRGITMAQEEQVTDME